MSTKVKVGCTVKTWTIEPLYVFILFNVSAFGRSMSGWGCCRPVANWFLLCLFIWFLQVTGAAYFQEGEKLGLLFVVLFLAFLFLSLCVACVNVGWSFYACGFGPSLLRTAGPVAVELPDPDWRTKLSPTDSSKAGHCLKG